MVSTGVPASPPAPAEIPIAAPEEGEDRWRVELSVDGQRRVEPEVLGMVDRRQAWQFRIMPLRRDGEEIMVATLVEQLPRAMRFALRHFREPCYFVLATAEALGEALMEHYPLEGMSPDAVWEQGPDLFEGTRR